MVIDLSRKINPMSQLEIQTFDMVKLIDGENAAVNLFPVLTFTKFGCTKSDIKTDVLANKRSTIEERIKAEKKAGACECASKNPSGK